MQASAVSRVGRLLVRLAVTIVVLAVLALAGIYTYWGEHGLNHVLHGSVMSWTTVAANDARMSAAMRLALRDRSVNAIPGAFAWVSVTTIFLRPSATLPQ